MRKPLLFIIPLIILGIAACKKLDNSGQNVTNEDAANLISNSIASSSGGLTTISSDVSLKSQTLFANNSGCGVTNVDSISHQSTVGASTTYSYKLKFTNKLTCNTSNQPDNVTSTLIFSGNYNGPKVILTNSGSTSFIIAGLTPGSSVYAINGEYKSTGTFKVKADTTRSGTVNIDIVVKNLIITKATATTPAGITGGTATATISGSTAKHGAFNFDGTLVFNGSSMATLTLSGTAYSVNLLTGVIVKQ
ncbi:MAG: hypothetical protein JWQ79_710 [Mucilaginibacter sp.]|jgi:hypothetical protein|nr:hypothetical protein [Mucilaginibacter sp.]